MFMPMICVFMCLYVCDCIYLCILYVWWIVCGMYAKNGVTLTCISLYVTCECNSLSFGLLRHGNWNKNLLTRGIRTCLRVE